MSAVVLVALLWVLFFGTHVGFATAPVRSRLVDRFGERGFAILFSTIASLAFVALVSGYAAVRTEGPPGLGLGQGRLLGAVLYSVVGFGVVLMIAGLWWYPSSNYAISTGRVREARGVTRVTRHPFFVGLACLGLAHVLLAPKLVGAIFMGGFALQALVGARHQDRKLAAARGPAYAAFLAETSVVPFAAIRAGRQRLAIDELPWRGIAVAVVVLRYVHEGIFAWHGAPLILPTVGGAGFFLVRGLRQIPAVGATVTGSP